MFFSLTLDAGIKVLCTAALIPQDYVARQQQYTRSLTLLKKYGCDVYVVESCKSGPTFLNSLCKNVCYTKNNDASLKNKGVNEARSMLAGLKHFNFASEDMVIKLTGRYPLEKNEFIQLVKNNSDADVIVRMWNNDPSVLPFVLQTYNAYTGIFAIRAKYLVDFLQTIDYQRMIDHNIGLEELFGEYVAKIKGQGAKIVYLKKVYDYLPVCSIFLHR